VARGVAAHGRAPVRAPAMRTRAAACLHIAHSAGSVV
jgi:hypothetical protein